MYLLWCVYVVKCTPFITKKKLHILYIKNKWKFPSFSDFLQDASKMKIVSFLGNSINNSLNLGLNDTKNQIQIKRNNRQGNAVS